MLIPQEIDDTTLAFPGDVKKLMPLLTDEIDREFGMNGSTKWNKLFTDLFFRGVKNLKLTPKKGIDEKKAWRHIQAIMRSFQPKHEHKTAACAYLMSIWFEDATWEVIEK